MLFDANEQWMGSLTVESDMKSCSFTYVVASVYQRQGLGGLLVNLIEAIYLYPYPNIEIHLVNANFDMFSQARGQGLSCKDAFWKTAFGRHMRAINFELNIQRGDQVVIESEDEEQWIVGGLSRVTKWTTEEDIEAETERAPSHLLS